MGVDFITANSSRLNIGSNALVNDQEPFTYSWWYFPRGSGATGFGRIISKTVSSGSGNLQFFQNGAVTNVRFAKDYTTTNLSVNMDNILTSNVWQHCCLQWDGSSSASGVRFFVNGVEAVYSIQTDGVGSKQSDSACNLAIGGQGDVFTSSANGIISEFAMWGSALLSMHQIGYLASSRVKGIPLQINPPTGSLVLYIPTDDFPDNLSFSISMRDRGINGLHATPSNGTGGANPVAKAEEALTYP